MIKITLTLNYLQLYLKNKGDQLLKDFGKFFFFVVNIRELASWYIRSS